MISEKTVKKYCSEPIENIENYEEAIADTSRTWVCHHKLEINPFNSNREDSGLVSRQQLKDDGMYYHRPACELIFLTDSEHKHIHATHKHSLWLARIINKTTGKHRSDGTKRKMSKSHKGNTYARGKKWWHNGNTTTRSKECPGKGWVQGMRAK